MRRPTRKRRILVIEELEARIAPALYISDYSPRETVGPPFSSITVTFSEEIDGDSFTPDDVEILDPNLDPVRALRIQHLGDNRYRIHFATQNKDGSYRFYVGPDIRNTSGIPMDQDMDGTPGEPVQDVFWTDVMVDARGPHITGQTPSGFVKGPVSQITVYFNEPINAATFSTADVQITRPGGSITVTGVVPVEPVDPLSFRISFASQSAQEPYTVRIGPNIADRFGNLMDQNQNGVNGQAGVDPAGDRYEGTFAIDNTGPRITGHTPSGLVPGPVSQVQVTFNEAINSATFTPADVQITDQGGFSVTVLNVGPIEGNSFRITFPSETYGGLYNVSVGPDITDLAGNKMSEPYNASFTIADTQGPRIVSHMPNGPTIAPVSSVVVTFDDLVNRDSFTTAEVQIVGPNGAIAPTAVAQLSRTEFSITFTEQTDLGDYHVNVGPNIEDYSGNRMDQDRDGVQGETPDDVYDAFFHIGDWQGPYITGHSESVFSTPADNIVVFFNERINPATFTTEDALLVTPMGPVATSAIIALPGDTSFRIVFPVQSAFGSYQVYVGPDIKDLSGNRMDQNQNGVQGEGYAAPRDDRYYASFLVLAGGAIIRDGQSYSYKDANGDLVTVALSGSGRALLRDTLGNAPYDSDATSLSLTGTDSSTVLNLTLDPIGGRDFSFGSCATAAGETIKETNIYGRGGTISDSRFTINGSMDSMTIDAVTNNLDAEIAGNLAMLEATHGLANGSVIEVNGRLTMVQVHGDMTNMAGITVGGDLPRVDVMGRIVNSNIDSAGSGDWLMVLSDIDRSTVHFGGNLSMLFARGNVTASTLDVDGWLGAAIVYANMVDSTMRADLDLNVLSVIGSVTGTSRVETGGDLAMFVVIRGMDGPRIDVTGDLGIAVVVGGVAATNLTIGGSTQTFMTINDMSNSNVTLGAGAGTFLVVGDMFNSALQTNGYMQMGMVTGRMHGSTFTMNQEAGTIMVLGGMTNSAMIDARNNVGTMIVAGGMNASTIDIDGNAGMAMVMGGLDDSTVGAGGNVNMAMVMGGMRNSSLNVGIPGVGGNLGMGMLMGGMDNSNVNVEGDANMLTLMGGDIANGSSVNVGGDAGMVFLMGDLLTSTVDVNGEARMLFGFGDVDAGGRIEAGNVRMGMMLGDVAGRIVITGNFTGSVMLFKGMQAGGGLQVGGDFEGRVSSFKDLLCDVDIAGDMSGDLLATLFGNVTIQGSFSGRVGSGSTEPGTGNTLTVNGGTNGGVVTPGDAFENYVGYP